MPNSRAWRATVRRVIFETVMHTTNAPLNRIVIATAAVLLAALGTAATAAAGDAKPLSPVAESGRSFFLESCAACHGKEGRGDGPAAATLREKPADLTLIARRRDGNFPMRELADIIDGRSMLSAHGDREMPVWGERFSEDEGGDSMTERLVQGRIVMLLVYLKAIQE